MSKHTIGSWRIGRLTKHGSPIRIISGGGKTVAFVPEDDTLETKTGQIVEFVSKEGEANACLIAAAPALLAALKAEIHGCVACDDHTCDKHEEARDAIAKATGDDV